MNMQENNELQRFTIEEFQADFDNLFARVEAGETFVITSENGDAVIVPYKEVIKVFEDAGVDEELIRIHTEHTDAS